MIKNLLSKLILWIIQDDLIYINAELVARCRFYTDNQLSKCKNQSDNLLVSDLK